MDLVVATTNPHKLREFTDFLAPYGVQVRGLLDLDDCPSPPPEEAPTFEENARSKARAYARALTRTCLADDSGLEVEALGGAPGVRSARYAGVDGPREERDRANREKLIAEVRALGVVSRKARLVCALCLVDETGAVLFETRETFEGELIDEPRGGRGFGYDAHLWLPKLGKTAAELEPRELDEHSHRGRATRALVEWLARRVPPR